MISRLPEKTILLPTLFLNYLPPKSSILLSFVFSHVWATCRHSNHSPTRSGTPYPGPFRLRGATVRKRFPTNCTRPPVRSKARAWCRSLFARCPHDTWPREALLREPTLQASESGSPKVPSSHRFSHTVRRGRRKSSVASGRRWPTRFTFFHLCSPMSGRPAAIRTTRQLDQEPCVVNPFVLLAPSGFSFLCSLQVPFF